MIQIHHALGFQVFVALRCVGATIDGGVVADKLAHTVLRLAGSWQVVEDYRQFVLVESFVHVGDVTVNHVEQTIHLDNDDTVALGVTLGLDVVDAVGYLLAFGEVVIGTVGIADGDDVRQSLQFSSIYLFLIHINLRVGKTFQFAGMVRMFVGNQNLRHLFWLVAEVLEGIHIATDILAGIDGRILIGHFLWESCWQAGIYQNHLATRINQIVLKTAAIADVLIKFLFSFLTSEYEGLSIESVSAEFYCFNLHNLICFLK